MVFNKIYDYAEYYSDIFMQSSFLSEKHIFSRVPLIFLVNMFDKYLEIYRMRKSLSAKQRVGYEWPLWWGLKTQWARKPTAGRPKNMANDGRGAFKSFGANGVTIVRIGVRAPKKGQKPKTKAEQPQNPPTGESRRNPLRWYDQ